MMPIDSSDRPTQLDINDLPASQQDRVIRFASELAKCLRQIQLASEQPQKNNNVQKSGNHQVKNNERK